MKTILIAGGAGFIGSNLCFRLIKKNKVICIDNLLTGNLKNIEKLLENKNFTFLNHDIINPIIINSKIDEIYNLACVASPKKYQNDPIHTLKTNFLGNLNLLELAKKNKCKILLSSTSEIYGEPNISPQTEEYRGNVNTCGPRSCYDEGKRIAETLFYEFKNKYNIDIKIARIFNTYGPNMDIHDGRVVSNFIYQMITNNDITIYGNGSQTRSFCYIEDLLDGLIKLMNSKYNKPINLGNTNEININKLVSILSELINSKSKIVYTTLPKDDPTNRRPDISKAKKIINWEPKYDLKYGLKKTIDYFINKI